ncbi:MAG: MotA/TolQ/ExbB proton channel family protein [Gammaproteobacteria bacterium]|nr:MotA/TolQ/ExbB proton channel family protein [Gammaproteobacteria bacterium]
MKTVFIKLILGATLIFSLPAFADSTDLDSLLEHVKKYGALETKQTVEREKRFAEERDKQKSLLQQAENDYRKEKQRNDSLKIQYKKNQQQVDALEKKLRDKMGNLSELVGVVRQYAGETIGELQNSIISSQIKKRKEFIQDIAKTKTLPAVHDLEQLWYNILQEMTESGKVATYTGDVVQPSGDIAKQTITRVGSFSAFSNEKFLKYLPDTQQLAVLTNQPSSYSLPDASDMSGTKYVGVTIDPTRGTLLSLFGEIPGLWQRIKQGKSIGFVIILIGIAGFSLAIERLISLNKTYKKIIKQKISNNIDTKSPLGRIIEACKDCNFSNILSLEKKLDEAITKELPFLEKGLSTIKILAVISPLLGLLGTVTGIIETFQSITLFGTGDPRLMASGISQALVTTALGLITAVPLILMHNMAITKAKACAQILEEQSASILAGRMPGNAD